MASKVSKVACNVIKQTGQAPTGSIIFLHGSGDTANGISDWVKGLMRQDFTYSHLRIIFPSAPMRPYSLYGGQPSTVWFDRLDLSPDAPEHLESVDSMAQSLKAVVQSEMDLGIPINRIVLGGFSMGGCMGLHLGYRFLPQVAGIFGLSCFLNKDSAVYKALEATNALKPPLFLAHGEDDSLVPASWGKNTYSQLLAHGINGSFHSLHRTEHELSKAELKALYGWILQRLPVL